MKDGVQLTGLWKSTSKAGDNYLSGNFGSGRLMIVTNKFKKTEKHPDYIMYVVPPRKKEVDNNTSFSSDANSVENIGW